MLLTVTRIVTIAVNAVCTPSHDGEVGGVAMIVDSGDYRPQKP